MILIRVSFNPIMLFTAKENGRGKKRETSGMPRVWIADLVCARHSLDLDPSRNSRNKMRAHIICRIGRTSEQTKHVNRPVFGSFY